MNEIIETSADGRLRVRLEVDRTPSNPRRDYDHINHVITAKGTDYIDIDPDGGPLQYGWDYFAGRSNDVELFTRWARIFYGAVVVVPVWHEGPGSLWYMTPEQIAEIGNTPEEAIRGEIEEYRAWAEGEVYGYVIEKAVDWSRRDGQEVELTTWEEVEDCWNYIGYEYAKQAARDAFATYKDE